MCMGVFVPSEQPDQWQRKKHASRYMYLWCCLKTSQLIVVGITNGANSLEHYFLKALDAICEDLGIEASSGIRMRSARLFRAASRGKT